MPPPKAPTFQITPATSRAVLANGSIAVKVIAELKLHEPPHNLTPQTFIEDALQVEHLAGTNVVRVRVKLRTPELAADASRRLARHAVVLTQHWNPQEGAAAYEQLKNPLAEAFQRFSRAADELVAYHQQSHGKLAKEDAQAIRNELEDLLDLTVKIEREKARVRAAEEEITHQNPVLTVGRPPTTLDWRRPAVDPESPDLTSPIINPVYQTLDTQISTTRSWLAALEQERREIARLRKIGGAELARLNELYRTQIQLARLQSNLELAKKVYSDIFLRSEEARTQAFGNSPQLQLVDEAFAPDRPLPAGRLRALLLGLIAGAFGAGLIALRFDGYQMRRRGQNVST